MASRRLLTAAAALASCVLATSSFAEFNDIPNSIKYSDRGKKNATGRSGSATIEARALMGRDGSVELAVTTGSFDSGAAGAGNIDKVQVKHPVADVTRNFNGLGGGGSFSTTLTGVGRGESLQVQANVSGIDPNRTDVVTLTETVKLRPDLLIEEVRVGPAAAGVPFQVSAMISERYGDVGARADCVLRVGGAEVDRANGIWVDAHGTVTCHFRHTLHAAGSHELQVAVTNVNPGDYDEANNVAAASVQVYASAREMPRWHSGASDESWEGSYTYRSSTMEMNTHDSGWSTMSSFSAYFVDQEESFRDLRVSYEEFSDGRQVAWIGDANWHYDEWVSCAMAHEQGTTFEKCIYWPGWRGPEEPILYLGISRGGGAVTYRSHGWYMAYNWGAGRWDRYTFNNSFSWAYGQRVEFGDTVAMTVRAADRTTLWEATPFMTMTPKTTESILPYRCYTDWRGEPYCFGATYRRTGRVGSDFSD